MVQRRRMGGASPPRHRPHGPALHGQNRQSEIDRRNAEHDYRINVKAELEIELLHNKIDALREQEIVKLVSIIERLSAHLAPELLAAIEAEAAPPKGSA